MRRIILTIILAFGMLPPFVPANAATEGCPDTWKIDYAAEAATRKSGGAPNQELRRAQLKYGSAMILRVSEKQITKFEGFSGSVPKLEKMEDFFDVESGYFSDFWRSFLYLYGKSTLRFTQKVELKDCNSFGLFTFEQNVPTGGLGGNYTNDLLKVTRMDSAGWAEGNLQEFSDFKAQANFSQYLAKLTSDTLLFAKKLGPYKKEDDFVRPYPLGAADTQSSGLNGNQRLVAQLLTPDCTKTALDESGKQFNLVMKMGKDCKFAWSVHTFRPKGAGEMVNDLVIFNDVFTVNYSQKNTVSKTTITCIKGKLMKKVSGSNPKCPKGYKKK